MTDFDKLTKTLQELNERFPFPTMEEPKNIYVNGLMWQRILTEIPSFKLGKSMDHGLLSGPYFGGHAFTQGVNVYSDEDVPDNQFIHCTAADFALYKELCRHPWLDVKTMTDDQINYLIGVYKRQKPGFIPQKS